MSWIAKLYDTYEAALTLPVVEGKLPLMPISHTSQNAHIKSVIDGAGNFIKASVLPDKTQVILPATEKSAGRTSGEEPHPLADKLQYVAKDYEKYGGKKKPYFKSFYDLLTGWCDSEYAHPNVQAVLQYVSKGTVIEDLIKETIVYINADNVLLTQWNSDNGEAPALFKLLPKDKGVLDQGSALVCWSVHQENDPNEKTWEDRGIQQSWIAYTASAGNNAKGLCYITGEIQTLAMNHPKKIRHSGDGAKLISSNDWQGFTFLGRFTDEKKNVESLGLQSLGIGAIATQKAHNALSWLIQRQGFRNGDQVYIAWAVSGKEIPDPLVDAYAVMDYEFEEINLGTSLAQDYALRLKNYMAGYAGKLSPNEQIIIMGIDSATPGRMGVIYYREKNNRDFLDCLEQWHKEFAWYQRHTQEIKDDTGKKPKTKVIYPIGSPVPKDIIKAAYGENVTDNLKKKTIERLLPCIVDGSSFPFDLVQSCMRKATNRVAYASDEQWLWEKNLGITCALYKGFRIRQPATHTNTCIETNQRRHFAMALEENYHTRDYLYGRLLAVAERIEEVALSISGENRSTNAARLMQRFADHPAQTWLTIYKALDPYIQRLQVSRTAFLNNQREELETISNNFTIEDFNNNAPLSGEFLLGYYCQRQKMKQASAESSAHYKAKQTKNIDETTTVGEPQ